MDLDLGTLTLGRAVLHQIERRAALAQTAEVVLSHADAILKPSDRSFILNRLVRAIQNHAVPVIAESDEKSGASLVGQILADEDQLVPLSHALAHRLAETQFPVSPPGLLLVGVVTDLKKNRGLVVAKLEHESGIQAVAQRTESGLATYSVTLIEDLVLSDAGKVYKVAIFEEGTDPLLADVVDRQSPGKGVAQYFLGEFLGCRLVAKPDVLTQKFHDATQKYIKACEDSSKAARLQVALLSEMQSSDGTLNPREFINRHVPEEDRDAFATWIQERDAPMKTFQKDTTRIDGQIQKVRMEVNDNVIVLAPAEEVTTEDEPNRAVSVNTGEEVDIITVRGKVTGVSGASGRG